MTPTSHLQHLLQFFISGALAGYLQLAGNLSLALLAVLHLHGGEEVTGSKRGRGRGEKGWDKRYKAGKHLQYSTVVYWDAY